VSTAIAKTAQRLPSYLPTIYRDDPFLGQYLWAFEQVLLGLEAQIGNLATVFDPTQAPEDFLPWLSTWVAFTLRADLEPAQQQQFLARIVPLYRRRGTTQNLQDLLFIFTGGTPIITEAVDTEAAHHFTITLSLPLKPPAERLRQIAIAHGLIDLEKPAHTVYELKPEFPSMQIGVTSHVGIDTLLGTLATSAGRDLVIDTTDATASTSQTAGQAGDTPTDTAPTPRSARRRKRGATPPDVAPPPTSANRPPGDSQPGDNPPDAESDQRKRRPRDTD
jgi:phage tail-like protein